MWGTPHDSTRLMSTPVRAGLDRSCSTFSNDGLVPWLRVWASEHCGASNLQYGTCSVGRLRESIARRTTFMQMPDVYPKTWYA